VRVSKSAGDLAASGGAAVAAARVGAGKIATLIVPANHAWESAESPAVEPASIASPGFKAASVGQAAALLSNGKRTGLVLAGRALRQEALDAAGRIAGAAGADLLCETFPARLQRGAGRVPVQRIPYFAEKGAAFLEGYEQLILVGAKKPVAFFAYPGKPSLLAPEACTVETLATVDEDAAGALTALAAALDAPETVSGRQPRKGADAPCGELTPGAIGQSLCRLLPENAIVVDEAITCSQPIYTATEGALAHDWMAITGGSIGFGLPLALGASVACPDRKVVALQADGSAAYTLQALWTMAREQSDVTVVLLNNSSYGILNIELARVGAGKPNEKTLSMFDLGNPDLDWVGLARGMGVHATRAETAGMFDRQFGEALKTRGPRLIEAVVPVSLDEIFG
jgi:acetolactate synthase-1/2/3 large subunit